MQRVHQLDSALTDPSAAAFIKYPMRKCYGGAIICPVTLTVELTTKPPARPITALQP